MLTSSPNTGIPFCDMQEPKLNLNFGLTLRVRSFIVSVLPWVMVSGETEMTFGSPVSGLRAVVPVDGSSRSFAAVILSFAEAA